MLEFCVLPQWGSQLNETVLLDNAAVKPNRGNGQGGQQDAQDDGDG